MDETTRSAGDPLWREGVLDSDALARRASRPPDFESESRVLADLGRTLAADPGRIPERLAAAVIDLCGVESAGVSIRGSGTSGRSAVFHWDAAAGAIGRAGDAATERDRGPSALALEEGGVLLVCDPGRFPELAAVEPAIVEALVVSFSVDGKPAGALWAISHTPERRLDAEDARALDSLSHFASAGYRDLERARRLERAPDDLYDLVENASIAIRRVGADGTILWANQAELDMLGYERDEYLGRSIAEFHVDRDVLEQVLDRLKRSEPVYDYPARLRCRDGTIRDVLVSSSALWRDGEFVHARCFTRDVTERRKGQEARARLAAIVEHSEDAIVSKDLEGIVTSWNASAERLYGYSAAEAIGQPMTLVIPPDRLGEEPGIMQRIRGGERVAHYETVRRRKDGTLFDASVAVSPIVDGQGRSVGASSIARDISGRKRTERLLVSTKADAERQRRLYETIISNTPDLVYVVDLDYRFTFANDALLRMWGRTFEDSVGKGLREIGYEEWLADRHEREFGRIVETKEPVRGQVPFPHATLGRRTYDYIFVPVLDADGEVEAIAGTTRDVSEQKKAEQDLRESRERLRDLNHSLEGRVRERTDALERQAGQLRALAAELTSVEQRERKRLAALLHDDLQQLLVAAQMRLGQAGDGADEAVAGDAIAATQRLLHETMAASRNLTRQLRPPLLYEDGLLSALKGLAADIESRYRLRVVVDTEDEDEPALDDDLKALLFECSRELLINSAKHAGAEEATVEVRHERDRLRLVVRDQGAGFTPDAESPEHRGEGFGMFSIRERLAALGGELRINSAPGEGTRVELEVPAAPIGAGATAKPPTGPASAGDRQEDGAGQRARVLVVDDHALVRQGIAHVLGDHERLVVIGEAGDGIEAIEMVQHQRPDVVLMDVNMPRMNGIEATREIRRRWPDAVTVGLSVQDDAATTELMREAGVAGFLPKSGDAQQMIATILGLVDAHAEGR